MHALGYFVVDPSVRCHFKAPVAAYPVLCRGQKILADSPVSIVLSNVPPLDIAHWARRVASVRMGTEIDFQETSYDSMTRLGDQNDKRHRYNSLALENLSKFSGMLLGRSLRPHGLSQTPQLLVLRQLTDSPTHLPT